MAISGSYPYSGSTGASGALGLNVPRLVNMTRYSTAKKVQGALTTGIIEVTMPIRARNWNVPQAAMVTVYDNAYHEATAIKDLTFNRNPTNHVFQCRLDLDSEFDLWNITAVDIVSLNGGDNLYLDTGECYVYAFYVVPTNAVAPENVWCEPASVASGWSTLHWSDYADGEFNRITGFEVYRSETYDGKTQLISGEEHIPADHPYMAVESREERDKSYFYRVKAYGERTGFDSDMSETVGVLTTEWSAPYPPTNLQLSDAQVKPGAMVTLSWDPARAGNNNTPRLYEVYRQADVYEYELIGTTAGLSMQVQAPIENGVTYRFKVRALGVVLDSDSELSAASSGLNCVFTAPTAPKNLTVNYRSSINADPGTEVVLRWTGSVDGVDNPLIGYRIYINDTEVDLIQETQYKINAGMMAGDVIRAYVRAAGEFSNSQPSNVVSVTTNIPALPPRSNEAITQFLFFGRNDELLYFRDDAITMRVVQEEFRLNGSFPYNKNHPVTQGLRIGWMEGDELRIYEIRQVETMVETMVQEFEAEHVAISELSDTVIEAVTYEQQPATVIVTSLLQGTGWRVGNVTISAEDGTLELEFSDVWSALLAVRNGWGFELVPRLAYTYDGIERYIDLLDRRGEYRGVRLMLDINAQSAGIIYDDRQQYTAMYGVGAVVDTETNRRLTFDGIAWSVEDGRPVNKPVQLKYVEDPEATALYGRHNQPRFGVVQFDDITNQHALLQATWDTLQACREPRITIAMTAFDLGSIGYAEQGIALGDDVVVILDPIGVELKARITNFDRDILQPWNSKPTIGYERDTILGKISDANKKQIVAGGGYAVDVDPTLSVAGMAADAKTVGDRLNNTLPADVGLEGAGKFFMADENGFMQLRELVFPESDPVLHSIENPVSVSTLAQTTLGQFTIEPGTWLLNATVYTSYTGGNYMRLWILLDGEQAENSNISANLTADNVGGTGVNTSRVVHVDEETTVRFECKCGASASSRTVYVRMQGVNLRRTENIGGGSGSQCGGCSRVEDDVLVLCCARVEDDTIIM